VLRYRDQGLTQAEVAKRLSTSRENVCEIERRARLKIDAARATLAALDMLDSNGVVTLRAGLSIYEAVSRIFLRADILEIKLRITGDDLLAAIRSRYRVKIRGHHFISSVKAEVCEDGSVSLKVD
jgi:hypothetical protein